MGIDIIKRTSSLALIPFVLMGILLEANAQQKEISQADSSCYSVVSGNAPLLSSVKIVGDVEKSRNQIDFLEIYDFGDYQLAHEYVRVFYSKGKWYFESSKKSPTEILNATSLEYLKTLAVKNKEECHTTFLCVLGYRRTSKYLLFIDGKMMTTLVVNTDLEKVMGDSRVQEAKELFMRFISEFRRLNDAH